MLSILLALENLTEEKRELISISQTAVINQSRSFKITRLRTINSNFKEVT
jgi:hypothetical protein